MKIELDLNETKAKLALSFGITLITSYFLYSYFQKKKKPLEITKFEEINVKPDKEDEALIRSVNLFKKESKILIIFLF